MYKRQDKSHQFAIYKHSDTENPHLHVVVNRVDLAGTVHNNSFIANRLQVACDKTEKDLELRRTPNRIFSYDPNSEKGYSVNSARKNKTLKLSSSKNQTRQQAENHIKRTYFLESKSAQNPQDLQKRLANHGIQVDIKTNVNGIYGLAFRHNEYAVKASKLGFKAKELNNIFARNQAKQAEISKLNAIFAKNQPKQAEIPQPKPEITPQNLKAQQEATIEHNARMHIAEWKSLPETYETQKAKFKALVDDYSRNPKQDRNDLHAKYGFSNGKFEWDLNAYDMAKAREMKEISENFNRMQSRLKDLKEKPKERANFWDSSSHKQQVKLVNSMREDEIKSLEIKIQDLKQNAQSQLDIRMSQNKSDLLNSGYRKFNQEMSIDRQRISRNAYHDANIVDMEKEILKRENPKAFELQEQRERQERERAKQQGQEQKQEQPQRRGGYGR